MSTVKGIGLCGLCLRQIDEGVPVRHWRGHIMRHKNCTPEEPPAFISDDDQPGGSH